jgi:hypothetical protein
MAHDAQARATLRHAGRTHGGHEETCALRAAARARAPARSGIRRGTDDRAGRRREPRPPRVGRERPHAFASVPSPRQSRDGRGGEAVRDDAARGVEQERFARAVDEQLRAARGCLATKALATPSLARQSRSAPPGANRESASQRRPGSGAHGSGSRPPRGLVHDQVRASCRRQIVELGASGGASPSMPRRPRWHAPPPQPRALEAAAWSLRDARGAACTNTGSREPRRRSHEACASRSEGQRRRARASAPDSAPRLAWKPDGRRRPAPSYPPRRGSAAPRLSWLHRRRSGAARPPAPEPGEGARVANTRGGRAPARDSRSEPRSMPRIAPGRRGSRPRPFCFQRSSSRPSS